MGLDTTHDAWHGSYNSFNNFREAVREASGHSRWIYQRKPTGAPAHWTSDNYMGDWEEYPRDPLLVFLIHSDCDGHIKPDIAEKVAERLEELAPKLHIYADTARQFAAGLRAAARQNQILEFR